MDIIKADIWNYTGTHHIVIGTNVGWDEKADPPMRNNMGEGLASQARDRYRRLAWWYGLVCCAWTLEQANPVTAIMPPQIYSDPLSSDKLILFPVKPLCVSHPELSWDQKASMLWIGCGLRWLCVENGHLPIAIPLVGAGNGGLDPDAVLNELSGWLRTRPGPTIIVDNR